jgi:intracellular sulfur oxidation DsrE/DsrF family protein
MKNLLSIPLLLLCFGLCQAQEVRIVFDMTSDDPKIHASTMRHIEGMSAAYPNSTFELVIYSGALPMVLKEKSALTGEILKVLERENVTINVCAMTLKRYNLDESALITGVKTVPDGILEIVQRQNEGWGYIKEAY